MREGKCFFCREKGHCANECPKKRNSPSSSSSNSSKQSPNDAYTNIRAMINSVDKEEHEELFKLLEGQGF